MSNRRGFGVLLNPWHANKDTTPPPPYAGYYDGNRYLKWITPNTVAGTCQLPAFRHTDGVWYPESHPSRVVRIQTTQGDAYIYIVLSCRGWIRYRGKGWYDPFDFPRYGGEYWGSRSPYWVFGTAPPYPPDKEFIVVDEVEVYQRSGTTSDGQKSIWTKYTDSMSLIGVRELRTDVEEKELDWDPQDEDYLEWDRYPNNPNAPKLYYKETGMDVLPRDLPRNGSEQFYGAGEVVARDDQFDKQQTPFNLGGQFDDPQPYTEFLAFTPQDDEYTERWYRQELDLNVYAYVINACTDCWYKGKNFNIKIAYEEGNCTKTKDAQLQETYTITFEGGSDTESVTASITDENYWYGSGTMFRVHKLETIKWDNLDPTMAKRVTDFYVESID